MLSNSGAREDAWESLGLQEDQTKKIKPLNSKGDQPWIFIGKTDAEAEASVLRPPDGKSQLIGKYWKYWERLKAKGEEDGRRWDGEIASPTQWTWIWANFGRQWKTEEPGVLQSIRLQRVRHDLVIEQQQSYVERLSLKLEKFGLFYPPIMNEASCFIWREWWV